MNKVVEKDYAQGCETCYRCVVIDLIVLPGTQGKGNNRKLLSIT